MGQVPKIRRAGDTQGDKQIHHFSETHTIRQHRQGDTLSEVVPFRKY